MVPDDKAPPSKTPPAGVCIHELATMIQKAERVAPKATMAVAKRWLFRPTRCQPKSMMPRKLASSMNPMAASKPSMFPKKSAPALEKGRPVHAEFEFEGNAGDYSHRDVEQEETTPEAGVL